MPFPPAPPALLASTPVGTRAVASRDAVSRCSSASATARGRRKPTQRRSRGGDLPPTFMPASTTPTAERREGGLTMVHCRWNRAERRAQGALSGQRPPGQLSSSRVQAAVEPHSSMWLPLRRGRLRGVSHSDADSSPMRFSPVTDEQRTPATNPAARRVARQARNSSGGLGPSSQVHAQPLPIQTPSYPTGRGFV